MRARPLIARRSLRIFFAFLILTLDLAASYLVFLATRDAALSERFSAGDAGGIGIIAGFFFFQVAYAIALATLALIDSSRSKG